MIFLVGPGFEPLALQHDLSLGTRFEPLPLQHDLFVCAGFDSLALIAIFRPVVSLAYVNLIMTPIKNWAVARARRLLPHDSTFSPESNLGNIT